MQRTIVDRLRGQHGLLLFEVVVALALTTVILGATLAFTVTAQRVMLREPDAADLHQRAREAFARLYDDALLAGAGPDIAAPAVLRDLRPAVVPYAMGRSGATLSAFRAVTFMHAPPQSRPHATILTPLVGESGVVDIDPGVVCPAQDPLCGFPADGEVLVFDDAGRSDLFRILGSQGRALRLARLMSGGPHLFDAGSHLTPVELDVYYFDDTRRQLRHYDGWAADLPLIDDVVDFGVTLYGGAVPRSPSGFEAATCLAEMAASVPASTALTILGGTALADGPWCDHAGSRYDADLHRVVRLGIRLRLQVSGLHLRRPDAVSPAGSGSSMTAGMMAPDFAVTFDVSPRNLQ